MKDIHTAIEIDAPSDRVWSILTDLPRYREWNTFMPEVAGRIAAGERLSVRIDPPGGRGMTFKPRVVLWEDGIRFAWLGSAIVKGLFDGEHSFEVESLEGGRTRLVQSERFTGALVPLFWRFMERPTRAGFIQMNEDLKRRAESGGR